MHGMSNITKKALYLSYDGLLEPLGKSQVFEYTKSLASLELNSQSYPLKR